MFFSVIVPIYGVEAYLKDCVESVLSQSFTDYELILVDDGSKDACPRLCDEYAERSSRVRVIHKENGGLVSARKAGLQAAKGEYVLPLDGDDALLPDALETAHRLCMETDADVVSFAYRIYRKGELSEPVCEPASEGVYEKEKLKELVSHAVCDENMEHLFYFVWGKAIRRNFLEGYQYAVPETISLGEDLWIMVYICAASIVSYCIWFGAVKNGELSKLFIIKFAEPVFACIFGALILGENIWKVQYLIAFLLISGGILISNLRR